MGTSYCSICEMPFNSSEDKDDIVLGDYMEPILNQIQSKQDEDDQQIQIAIALSYETTSTTDSDDTDSTSSTSKCMKKRKKRSKNTSFAQYWQEMSEFHKKL